MLSKEAGLSRGLALGMVMGGCEATPPAEGIGKVHLFWVLEKRARLGGEARSIPPAGGSVTPCQSQRIGRVPRAPSPCDLDEPHSATTSSSRGEHPSPAPFARESRRATVHPAHPQLRMQQELFLSLPGGMATHLRGFSIPLDRCQAGNMGT